MIAANNMMHALAKTHAAPGIWAIQAPVPECGPDDVLIRVKRTAICGTDMHIYNWDDWAAKIIPVPMIIGHEFSGEIIEIGNAVTRGLKLGQRVSGEGHIINPHSAAARAGRFHLDPDTQGVGVNRPGAFAEYLAIPAFNVVSLPDAVSDDVGALLDPFGNAVHTAQQFDLLGEDVLVAGAGPIGIMAAAVARKAGARRVIITDINPYRLALAGRFTDCRPVNVAHEDIRDVMAAEGIADGFGVALEISGAPAAFDMAVDVLKMGGKLSMLGIPSGPVHVNWSTVILKAITIQGVYGREMFETWRKMLGVIESGLDLEPLITHRLRHDQFATGFETMASGQSGKVVLDWS
ncbi:L-threonine 3-dehydrogenase [Sandarakinorhabdus sp.]|uniref:L-threonine 3-dehydrogenase n=1 Tax=Sandarakinorhabdus sp. TaxID=1916663 RepID=UPI003F72232D